ncbi:hypothetical protein CHU92_09870 [Flavobacterium cyanobacteriorum]|uniref:DUF4468 domain-containing protein n=1 Tax=Flavobacterium cyanobacteriorum TaxID=2022802 RepID=A0A255Z4A8_9FLAO|nr:hypothetical protein [Flavobacterium cyanobacteriorum]OYQ36318.1 hypothetical protein CHU92_09870 [Flavobacterium cyanobacteriorum]
MKKILIMLLSAITALAQNDFKVAGQEISWEKSFPADDTNIVALLEKQPGLKVVSFTDNVYKGHGSLTKNNCESGSGLMRNNCNFNFLIMVNPDSYVVKVTNLQVLEKFGPMKAKTVASPCEKYFLGKEGLKKDEKTIADLNCLDNYLTDIFAIGSTGNTR